jgi:hypothetical protein
LSLIVGALDGVTALTPKTPQKWAFLAGTIFALSPGHGKGLFH